MQRTTVCTQSSVFSLISALDIGPSSDDHIGQTLVFTVDTDHLSQILPPSSLFYIHSYSFCILTLYNATVIN